MQLSFLDGNIRNYPKHTLAASETPLNRSSFPPHMKNTQRNISLSAVELPKPLLKVIKAAQEGKLIVVVGAGISISLTNGEAKSWNGLIRDGFNYGSMKGRITSAQHRAWEAQLASSDIDDLLSAAEFVSRKLGAPNDQVYARWLEESFGSLTIKNGVLGDALKLFSSMGIPICTLNYDLLLEDATELPSILITETSKVAAWMRRELPAILHLHGDWRTPDSCILGIRDYETTLNDELRDLFQRNLSIFNNLLFLGCGSTLSDPNFSALTEWLKRKYSALPPQHVGLTLNEEVSHKNTDASWVGFVDPIGYGSKHEDLADFLHEHILQLGTSKIPPPTAIADNANQVLDNYRSFLLRDCGQMTIEGVSADMDTGQRRFDLEKLFVPLKISACPPEFNKNDKEREAKLEKWLEKNKNSESFGTIFSKGKNLALLALPGGGKTLLLKRLAVAYADPERRKTSSDQLPDLPLMPLIIRCRDWREYIRQPIQTLLKNIVDITGQANLVGFSSAITPLLERGEVLLLIDGLDEIHNDSDRSTFVDNLESFLDEYKLIRIVITSREAGFNLVAPSLSRFCERWRISPLEGDAISELCSHWHRLMIGDTPEAVAEGQSVAQTILKNISVHRLAENPLLLTMLLVVKHGAGGLPPDRVSLYSRAVEVLLDTWNIKGHAPLNPREAVPQLSYVAFKLMCLGKQTATERELLELLEEARENLPHIRRYAKDSPHEFLKRVELRSSLLLEAGYQVELGKTVPFYQFRHLTFQEYLTAITIAEGNYENYNQDNTVVTPLKKYLAAEEWKEVIPMVAVLAKKQAEPLIAALVDNGNDLLEKVKSGNKAAISSSIGLMSEKLPGSISRIVQCLVEEAEASPKTLASALHLIAFFAKGCRSNENWDALCQGPYGRELYSHAWALFEKMDWHEDAWLMNTCASIATRQKTENYWSSPAGRDEVHVLLSNAKRDEIARGLLICMGRIWLNLVEKNSAFATLPVEEVEKHLFNDDKIILSITSWIWAVRRHDGDHEISSPYILDRLKQNWINNVDSAQMQTSAYALSINMGINRSHWKPNLSENEILIIKRALKITSKSRISGNFIYHKTAAFFIAYHAKTVMSDTELLSIIPQISEIPATTTIGAMGKIKRTLQQSLKRKNTAK